MFGLICTLCFIFFGVLQTVCRWPLWRVFLLEALLETPPALSGKCPGMQGVGSPLRFLESRIFQNANFRSGANYMTEALSSSFSWRAIVARPSSLPEAWPQTLTRHKVFC